MPDRRAGGFDDVTSLARIARLSAAFLASNLARGGIAFGLSLVVARALGVERFGRWALCTAWASTLTTACELGLGLLITRDAARGSRGGDVVSALRGAIGRLCGRAIAVRLAVAIPGAAAMIAVAPLMAADPETVRGLQIAALLGAGGAAYGCLGAAYRSQPAWVATILGVETTWHGVQLAASVLLLTRSPRAGVPVLVGIALVVQLLQVVTALALWRRAFGHAEPLRVESWRGARETLTRALPFAAAGVVANMQTRLAPLMLGYLSTSSELGAFAAAARFGTTARLAPGAIFAGALPVLAHAHGDPPERSRAAFASFDRAFAVLAVATTLPGLLFAAPLLRLVYGRDFVGAAPALVIISIGLLPSLTNSAAKIALYAADRERVATAWSAVSLAIQGAAAMMLVPRFGALGAGAAIAIGEAVIWLPLRRARTTLQMSPRSSPHRVPAPTIVPLRPAPADVADPAAVR